MININQCIYIIIVNFNGSKDTIECVKSIKNINYQNYKIVVVDNNSDKNNKELLDEIKDDAIFIFNKENSGFSKANNIGIKYSLEQNADFILLLNNDTVVTTEFLNEALKSFQIDNNIGIVSGKINYYDNNEKEPWYDGAKIDWFRFCGKKFKGKAISSNEHYVSLISGCMMLIRKDVFYNVGLLPEEYFMFYEDIDFCAMVANKGYKLVYNSSSVIYHKVSRSSGGSESPFLIKYCTRNWRIFINKYRGNINKFKYGSSIVYYYFNRYCHYLNYLLKHEKDKAMSIRDGIKEAKKLINN